MSARTPANDNDGPAFLLTVSQLEELLTKAICAARDQGIIAAPALTVGKQDLARQLGVCASHIDHLRKKGLPTMLVGQSVRFEPAKVIEWLREQQRRA